MPDDDVDNARITRVGVRRWKSIKERLRPLLIFDEKIGITQKRLRSEYKRTQDLIANARKAGKRSAEVRALQNKDLASTDVEIPLEPESNDPPTTRTRPKPNSIPTSKDVGPADLSAWMYNSAKTLLCDVASNPMTKKSAGGIITNWLKRYGEEKLVAAIDRAIEKNSPHPLEYINGTLRELSSVDEVYFGQRLEEQ